ncbi:unnamed protein product [Lupinus luteus]|uniref:VAL1-3 N-terminal zinc finger domain-containing protein n=1 Tax=Lupinus luteus TaxID=3873 RepID=A0AAV1WLB3_LUPLU
MDSIYSSSRSSKGKNIITGAISNCFYCNSETATIKNGWQLYGGDLARLCESCCSAYEDGSFCSRFHRGENGWRDCALCGKMLHCGCIISLKEIVLMDFGGICCLDCGNKYLIRVVNMPMNDCPDLRYNMGSESLACNPKYKLSTIYEEPMTDVQVDIPSSPCKAQSSAMAESSSSGTQADKTTGSEKEIIVYTRRKKLAKNNLKVYTRRNKSV